MYTVVIIGGSRTIRKPCDVFITAAIMSEALDIIINNRTGTHNEINGGAKI